MCVPRVPNSDTEVVERTSATINTQEKKLPTSRVTGKVNVETPSRDYVEWIHAPHEEGGEQRRLPLCVTAALPERTKEAH